MNDLERSLWVENNEELYRKRKRSKLGLSAFVRKHRKTIDRFIQEAIEKASDRKSI